MQKAARCHSEKNPVYLHFLSAWCLPAEGATFHALDTLKSSITHGGTLVTAPIIWEGRARCGSRSDSASLFQQQRGVS